MKVALEASWRRHDRAVDGIAFSVAGPAGEIKAVKKKEPATGAVEGDRVCMYREKLAVARRKGGRAVMSLGGQHYSNPWVRAMLERSRGEEEGWNLRYFDAPNRAPGGCCERERERDGMRKGGCDDKDDRELVYLQI